MAGSDHGWKEVKPDAIMSEKSKPKRIVGWIILALVCAIMIYSGTGKLFGFAPDYMVEGLQQSGLSEATLLIGAAEMISAILLLIPRTSSAGILLVSSFWGGAIVSHMSKNDGYVIPAVLLVMCWAGAFLRNSDVLSSFTKKNARS